MNAANEHIRVTQEGAVRTLAFQRVEKKNAFTLAMYEALASALAAADADPTVHVVVLAGQEGIFTAGNDLQDFVAHPPTGQDSAVFRFLSQLTGLEKPVLAAVDGPAVGIGTTMLLHCDAVYASERARFSLPFVNLALCPEGASSFLMPRLMGLQRASELLMFGEPFDAVAARDAGLVSRVTPPGELMPLVAERARTLAEKPLASLVLTKRLLREPLRGAVKEAFAREGAAFVERLASPEAKEAFQAFFERRKPNFSRRG
ncbi:MAG: enoyl-CoA hydratase [Myxococcaceae bacterium]|nr:enoyl-CoA hydratase [Myxococcaceae bacterium]MCI0673242.1 enoyl-CoA hydratase [Myxococcaceae bacterium]